MRLRSAVWGPVAFVATAVVTFSVAPVHAATGGNPAWGDISSVVAGPGLLGGSQTGDATLSIEFAGTGTANSAARSDHNHDDRYLLKTANFDDRYLAKTANFDDRYAPLGINFDDRYMLNTANFDDRYAPLGINFDDRYAPLGINFDDRYMLNTANFDDRYAALNHIHDDRYALLGHAHDDRYLPLTGGVLSGPLSLSAGDLTLLGIGSRVVAPQFVSTATRGTAPFEVSSDTLVANLNADKLDGHDASDFALAGSGPGAGYAALSAANAFTGINTFNAPTTFGAAIGIASGGATFTWQPLFSSPAAYQLRLVDSYVGATRLVMDQSGRFGIGTTNPLFPLHVVGDIRATNLNLGTALLGPSLFDMSSASDRTLSITNSGAGLGNLSVEGGISAAGLSISTGGASARAGNDAVAAGSTTKSVPTTTVGAASLIFVTPDASRPGCVAATGTMYVSARAAGSSFTVSVGGAAPGAGESYCFNWWVVN